MGKQYEMFIQKMKNFYRKKDIGGKKVANNQQVIKENSMGGLQYLKWTALNVLMFLMPEWIFVGIPLQIVLIRQRSRAISFNWIIPSIVFLCSIFLSIYFERSGIDIISYDLSQSSHLYGLFILAVSLKLIFFIYNLIFILKPSKEI